MNLISEFGMSRSFFHIAFIYNPGLVSLIMDICVMNWVADKESRAGVTFIQGKVFLKANP